MKKKTICLLLNVAALFAYSVGQDTVIVDTQPSVPPMISEKEPSFCDYLNAGLGTTDWDADGIDNCKDNCVFDPNKNQKDKDKNDVGDACEWRRRADEAWERIGRHQRQTATEPVQLARLVRESTNILLVNFKWGGVPEDNFKLSGHFQLDVIRELKGRAGQNPDSSHRGIWVWVPDGAGRELLSDVPLLVFLKDGKLRRWKVPHVWSAELINGKPRTETVYFGYNLADPRFGILGVSDARIKQIEKLVRGNR